MPDKATDISSTLFLDTNSFKEYLNVSVFMFSMKILQLVLLFSLRKERNQWEKDVSGQLLLLRAQSGTKHCTYNVILMRCRAMIVAMGKQ